MFVFPSDFRFDLNLQTNIVEFTIEFCIFLCDLNLNPVNFMLSNFQFFCNSSKFSLANVFFVSFFSRIFASICIFNGILLNSPLNSAFPSVI